jgi:hypothetical protein
MRRCKSPKLVIPSRLQSARDLLCRVVQQAVKRRSTYVDSFHALSNIRAMYDTAVIVCS